MANNFFKYLNMSSIIPDVNKFSFFENYTKPELSIADIDIDEIKNFQNIENVKCDVYNMILKKDYNNLKKYANSYYIQTNSKRQTPLMFACKIGDPIAVKILLNEVGNISLNYKSAIDYAIENGNSTIINMINQYEFPNQGVKTNLS